MTFLNPLDALIPFSFFTDFWVWVTSEARGSVSVGFLESRQLSPFWGGGSSQRDISTPPPPNPNGKPAYPIPRAWPLCAVGCGRRLMVLQEHHRARCARLSSFYKGMDRG